MEMPKFFPKRNPKFKESNCYYIKPNLNDFENLLQYYNKKITIESNNLRLQYFSIEKELINSFLFVNPVTNNLEVSSVKFATIIRESANLFEQISRTIYDELFIDFEARKINIINYLALDYYLNYNDFKFYSPQLEQLFHENPDIKSPFNNLQKWLKKELPTEDHIPDWWTAYNKIKHSPQEISSYATLENALKSILAAFIIISKYLGPGVVSGALYKPEKVDQKIIQKQIIISGSQLFIDTEHLLGFVF